MIYVLDASVALCWVIRRPLSPKALRLRDDYQKAIHELLAPSVFPAEAASALTKSQRQKLIPVGEARRLLGKILRTVPALHPYRPAPLPGHGHFLANPRRSLRLPVRRSGRAGGVPAGDGGLKVHS
jgi:hypothetical protein